MSKKNKRARAADAALEALYAGLPKLECQGRCQESCGLVEECIEKYEHERIALHLGRDPGFLSPGSQVGNDIGIDCLACPLLQDGACSVYPIRPLICRLWGVVDDPLMVCPHGCRPSRYLSNEEVRRLWRKLQQISRRYFDGE